ncbi:MAG: metal-dependent phosphohydrolase, partial [Nanoarchaeota archaeon]
NYPQDKIEQVKYCILSHRSSKNIKRETKEAQILADADTISHFDNVEGILKRVFKNDKARTLAKLERGYNKLSDDEKTLVKDKLEKARQELR